MVTTTADYKTSVQGRTREWYPEVALSTKAGNLTAASDGIKTGSLKIRETIGDGPGLGGAAMAEFRVIISLGSDAIRNNLNGGRATPRVGLKIQAGNIEYIPLGVFIIDTAKRVLPNFVEVHGFDNMSKAERPFALVPISYPTTIGEIYHKITQYCGITEETTTLPDFAATVNTAPRGDFSCRQILGYIAQRSHRIARMTRADGKLELVDIKTPQYITEASLDGNTTSAADGGDFSGAQTPDIDGGAMPANTPDATIGPDFRFSYAADDAPVIYTGIAYTMPNSENNTETDPEVLIFGTAGHAVDITGNPLIYTGTQAEFEALCDSLAEYIKTAKFCPFTMTYPGDPSIQAGDMISNTDRNGATQRSTAATVEFNMRGQGTISANGQSDSEAGYKTNDQQISNTIAAIRQTDATRKNQLEIATQTAAALIAGMSGGFFINGDDIEGGLHAGNIYISDNADINQAAKVWRMNLNGMGYSENGINGPFISSITADGQIVARLITADMIRTGKLQAITGSSFFDLDNGRIAARSTAGSIVMEAQEFQSEVEGTVYQFSQEQLAWYSITPADGDTPEVWGTDPDFAFRTSRGSEDYGEWAAAPEIVFDGDLDISGDLYLWEGAESVEAITLANNRSFRGQDTNGDARNLAGVSSYNNSVFGSASLPEFHAYAGESGMFKFYLGTTCVGYIDGSGFHNGEPPS